MNRSLYSQELSKSLNNFVREMHRLNLADNPQLVFQLGIKWTKGQSLLTKKLLQYILESKTRIRSGQEAARVEKIIRQRLLKEFKHDDLTLPIRKVIYVKDLARILIKSKGKIGAREQIYLTKIQQHLGLSPLQSEDIQAQYLKSKLTVDSQNNKRQTVSLETNPQSHSSNTDAFQDLVSLIEKSPIYEELLAQNAISNSSFKKPSKISGLLRRKYLGLYLAAPLLLLIIRSIQEIGVNQNARIVTAANDIQPNSYCSTKIESPRMSLVEKPLTPSKQLPSAAKIAFYEASAAFSKCQYTTAQNKFKQAVEAERNNPEASIYLNNTKAIANNNIDDNLKIAVSVPFQDRPAVADEILRGVAQAQLEINKQGGINSKMLLVQIVNNSDDREIMEEITQKLAADRSVLATVSYSDRDGSIAEVARQQGLAMTYTTHANPSSTNKTISIAPNIPDLANTLFSYASLKSFKKIAICADSDDITSSLLAEEFARKITQNGREITTVPCDLARNNFNPVPVVNQALAQNADAIFLSPSANSIERAISVAQIDRDRMALLGNHVFHTQQTIDAGETLSQLVLATPWLPDTVAAQKFADNARTLWNVEVNWRSAMSYDAIRTVADSLKEQRIGLKSVMSDRNFNLATAKPARLAHIVKQGSDSNSYHFLPLDVESKQPF